jgi:Zn-dependent oligopeptidase
MPSFSHLLRAHLVLAASAGAMFLGLAVPGLPGPRAAFAVPRDAAALKSEVQGHLDRAQKLLDQILAVGGPRTVDNTLRPLNDLSIEVSNAANIASLMENVHPDAGVRSAAETASQDVQAFVTALSLNRGVYDAVNAVDVGGTDAITRRLREHTLRDYRRAGVDKDEATREKIRALREELVKVGQEFDRNIREGTRSIALDGPEDLAGLPDDYVAAHPPDSTGKIVITTQYPDYVPFMTYAKSGDARRRLYEEFLNRGYPQNKEVLTRLITQRNELAHILGYTTWADYITEDKMIGSAAKAHAFVEQLHQASAERAQRDVDMLLARKRKDDPAATTVQDYEKMYYSELVRGEEFAFNSQELRDYFDFPKVKDGILGLTSTLFGVTYKRLPDADVWDPSVEAYEVYEGDKLLGRFYLDLHPRDGKYSHAAQFGIQVGVEGKQVPEAALVCNFPGGNGDGPALMEYEDVRTFLHEFGHLLHTIFGGHQAWADLSGIATEWDFVEAPSQMLEEWAQDTKTLQTFAVDYKTGEPIPSELVAKLRASREFGNGIYVSQQTFYSAISLDIYDRDPASFDLDTLVPELQAEYSSFPYVPGAHMYAAFGHLENYTAMYYTYMWSLVIAKDLFSKFDQSNLLDPAIATRYRKLVLDPGGTKDAADLVEEFLGRPFSFDAFRAWLNQGSS